MAEILILPVEPNDHTALAQIHQDGFSIHPIHSIMYPIPVPLSITVNNIFSAPSPADSTSPSPITRITKAVSSLDPSIPLGYAVWAFYLSSPFPSSVPPPKPASSYPPGANIPACEAFHGGMKKIRAKHMKGKKCAVLRILVVKPEEQGKGIGMKLMQQGLGEVDEAGVEAWLEASEGGRRLYRKMGFVDIDTSKVDRSLFGGEGEEIRWGMLRGVVFEG